MRRKKHKIFCSGCAYLFYVKGLAPSCTATAEFIDGPLRKHIGVGGIEVAMTRNARNDCALRRPVSLSAWEMKQWMLGRLNSGRGTKACSIKKYPIEEERTANSVEIGLSEEEAEHYDEIERLEEGSGDEEIIEPIETEEQDGDEEPESEAEAKTEDPIEENE